VHRKGTFLELLSASPVRCTLKH